MQVLPHFLLSELKDGILELDCMRNELIEDNQVFALLSFYIHIQKSV
jgi:hypothetical protein